jgi:predicted transposase/invertase (TIGR01784 family)
LPENRKTRLEKFLVLFNQAWCTQEPYIIDLQDIPGEFEEIAQYLQGPVMSDSFRKQLEAEQEIDEIFDKQEAEYVKKIEKVEKEKKLAEQREKHERTEKEREKKEKLEVQIKAAKKLKKLGLPVEEIAKITGLDTKEINKI